MFLGRKTPWIVTCRISLPTPRRLAGYFPLFCRISRRELTFPQQFRYPQIRCAFFGTLCDKMHVVPVPVQCASLARARPIDVMFRTFVNAPVASSAISFNMDRFMIEVQRYPLACTVEGPWRFTIFVARHVRDYARGSDLLLTRL